MKTPSPAGQKRLITFLSAICGLACLVYFSFFNPAEINPYLTTLIASCIFGPGVIAQWKGSDEDEDK